MSLFSLNGKKTKIYGGKWKVVSIEKIDDEDKSVLDNTALIEKSTYGKSFKFVISRTKEFFFIPADEAVDLPVGTRIKLDDLSVVVLRKEGCEDIQRIRVE